MLLLRGSDVGWRFTTLEHLGFPELRNRQTFAAEVLDLLLSGKESRASRWPLLEHVGEPLPHWPAVSSLGGVGRRIPSDSVAFLLERCPTSVMQAVVEFMLSPKGDAKIIKDNRCAPHRDR